ncbi:MAG: hypothetical protein GX248_11925 [Peptococcaceae bacterium]|jgi:hypothetical protein|nr:hypothetical protein [Peptococcaceae bacterium]
MPPLRKKVYAVIIVAVFCLIVVAGIGNYRAEQLAVKIAADQIDQALTLAARDLDIKHLESIIQTLDDQSPYYHQVHRKLIKIKQDHNLAGLAMLHKIPETGWIYIFEAREKNNPAYNSIGNIERRASVFMERSWKEQAVKSEYRASSSQAFVSRYLLLKDSQGNALAVLKGDLAAAEITDFLYTTRYVQIGAIVVSLLLIGFIVLPAYIKKAKA